MMEANGGPLPISERWDLTLWIIRLVYRVTRSGFRRNWSAASGFDEKRHGPGARRRLYLSGSGGKGVLHGQECVDAGPLRLDLRLSVPRVRSEGGVAGRQQELPGLHGAVLHQPGGGQPDVLHRHRRRQAAASAPLLLLRGLLCHRQRRVLRCYRRQGLPGAGPRGLRPDLEPEPGGWSPTPRGWAPRPSQRPAPAAPWPTL